MLAFVDDTRKFNNINHSHHEVHENVLADLVTWQKISSIVAGKLNIAKCGYYILQWQYNAKGYLEMFNADNPDITLLNEENTPQKIKRYDVNNASKYLGITTAPNGNKKHTIQVLSKICANFSYKLSIANLTPDETHLHSKQDSYQK